MKVCFAGGGRMASAMIGGLLSTNKGDKGDKGDKGGFVTRPNALPSSSDFEIMVADPDEKSRDRLAQSISADVVFANVRDMLSSGCDAEKSRPLVLVLAVKPANIEEVLRDVSMATHLDLVISIAAGITTSTIEAAFNRPVAVVRAMPNTPALVRKSITAISAGLHAGEVHMTRARQILASIGEVIVLQENLLDAVTAISGSGPAYFFLLMRELERSAVALGLAPEVAHRLVLSTASGSAELASRGATADEPDELDHLIKAVTSKGGTTERALSVFSERGFSETIHAATRAAYDRARELGS